ncbi:MAG: hypothetical protein SchgKO_11600 [Schleiferiaceae bacterium]|jgi:uncharacterized membrane protein
MYIGLKHLHSSVPYLLLLLLVVTLLISIINMSKNGEYTKTHDRLSLFTLILSHIQFLVGIVLLFVSPIAQQGMQDMGAAMKDPTLRLYVVEHPTVMILSIVLITIGRKRSKKFTGGQRHKQVAIFFGLALALMLSRIPWDAWL